jgi:hypothetical protein
MTEQTISPLRRRMIEDMTIRKCAQKTNMTMCNGSRASDQVPSPSLDSVSGPAGD